MFVKPDLLTGGKKIHFIGIGGIGVSALAVLFLQKGKNISGSDIEKSAMTFHLEKIGIEIFHGHSRKNIPQNTELVVHSLAISGANPEMKEARRRKIPIISYPEAVGELSRGYYTIAICGTHGKSTITAMIAKILIENNFDPTVIIGTKTKELGHQNVRVGKSKILILEACEYKRAFLNYEPNIIVLHTLDPDHLDYYRDFADYLSAFREFALKLPLDGYFLGNLDDSDIHEVIKTLQEHKFPQYNMFGYATEYSAADYFLKDDQISSKNSALGKLSLKIPGLHNRTNALAAFSACSKLGISPRDILKSLNRYTGAFRRFEVKGKIGKTTLIDDYGHHPAEIIATLQAARERYPEEKICVVFQPHQYSRTHELLKEFGASFSHADHVIIPNIYEARDNASDKAAVSPEMLVEELKKNGIHASFGDGIENTIESLEKHHRKFDVIITMGAGDVWKVAEALKE